MRRPVTLSVQADEKANKVGGTKSGTGRRLQFQFHFQFQLFDPLRPPATIGATVPVTFVVAL